MRVRQPKHPLRVATVVIGVLIAVNFAIFGARSQTNGPVAPERPVEIDQLFPQESQRILPQDIVGADLRDKFAGQLTIDNVLIPKDQTTGDPNLGQVLFAPGAGKQFREFGPGTHKATLEWWPKTITTPEDARTQHVLRSYTWNFNVG